MTEYKTLNKNVTFQDFYFEIEKLIFSAKFVSNLHLSEKAKHAAALPLQQNNIIHPIMNGVNPKMNKIVYYPNPIEAKPQIPNVMPGPNQYYSNIPNIIKRPQDGQYYAQQPLTEYSYPNNGQELSFNNYQNQSIDYNHQAQMNGIERLFPDAGMQNVSNLYKMAL